MGFHNLPSTTITLCLVSLGTQPRTVSMPLPDSDLWKMALDCFLSKWDGNSLLLISGAVAPGSSPSKEAKNNIKELRMGIWVDTPDPFP